MHGSTSTSAAGGQSAVMVSAMSFWRDMISALDRLITGDAENGCISNLQDRRGRVLLYASISRNISMR